ncbi:Hypothetical protein NTJ_06551 [Nesidiocoris tenuis]|uniref:Uncharacterized protein n=1 Tax=Nesidiocoris tenuis TaxID=355587 RepID=A0ABN7ANE0_9HEMI|nr:Hypothetical protein NTJ_06551 [Nesidiocoris tenuis]
MSGGGGLWNAKTWKVFDVDVWGGGEEKKTWNRRSPLGAVAPRGGGRRHPVYGRRATPGHVGDAALPSRTSRDQNMPQVIRLDSEFTSLYRSELRIFPKIETDRKLLYGFEIQPTEILRDFQSI